MERETGLEPATSSLGSWHSPDVRNSDSNQPPHIESILEFDQSYAFPRHSPARGPESLEYGSDVNHLRSPAALGGGEAAQGQIAAPKGRRSETACLEGFRHFIPRFDVGRGLISPMGKSDPHNPPTELSERFAQLGEPSSRSTGVGVDEVKAERECDEVRGKSWR